MSISDAATRAAVVEDIEQMDLIIAQFLAYARGESTEPTELSDINAIVNHVSGLHSRAANAPRVSQGVLPPTRIHPQALARALANLLDNARKYGGDQIAVETRAEKGSVVIDVVDRGPGIPESEIERLKRPFTRLENARTDANSTGLGLAIVERIARLHGGTLELLPREGGGLIARLRLPVRS
jgi:two-component system osmolarity sensor histidine kinase EnvZ